MKCEHGNELWPVYSDDGDRYGYQYLLLVNQVLYAAHCGCHRRIYKYWNGVSDEGITNE